jgi:hypothetical protein
MGETKLRLLHARGASSRQSLAFPPSGKDLPCEPDRCYAANDVGADDADDVALRTANETITRVTPLKMRLTPTKVPIAQAELDGHCM